MADEKIILTLEANDEASHKIEAISKALRNMDKQASSVGSGKSGISGMISSFDDGVRRVHNLSREWNTAMGWFNRAVIRGVEEMGSKIYDFTSDSIKNYTDFSEQHARVLGAMAADYDKTAESQARFFQDAQKLKDQAINIGTYGFNGQGSLASVPDVSQAQESLIKAGISPNDIINTDVLSDVLTFAQGNELDTDNAVSTAVTLGNQFNIPIDDWGLMLDKISHTADMSVVEVSDIVQSLKWASGISAGLNRPLEEVLGMITVLGDFGLKGSQAGTGIQALLSRILTGDTTVITQAQAEIAPGNALEKFYEFEKKAKPNGNLLPMTDVINELDSAMEGMTDEEQAWFAKKLFGLYQMKSAYALMNGENTDLDAVIKEIEDQSAGTNENKLQQLLNSQYGQLESLSNLWEGVKTDVGGRLSPFVEAIRDELFAFLGNNGNYDINFDNLKSALDESCRLIEEKYGSAIADAVRNVGEFTIDFTQVAQELAPEFGEGMLKLINDAINGGGLFGGDGVFSNWGSMIDAMYASAGEMPTQELEDLATAITSVVDWCGRLVAFNLGAKLIEIITAALQMLTITGSMIVKAGTVIVSGGTPTGTPGTGGTGIPTGGALNGSKVVGPSGKVLKGGKSVLGNADDVATALGTSADDVVATLGQKTAYTVDDVATALGTSADDVIAKFGKSVGGISKLGKGLGVAGLVLQVGTSGYEAYKGFSSGDNKAGTEALAGGAGSIGGGLGGAKLGAAIGTAIAPGIGTAIGGVLGAIAGAIAGDVLARKTAGGIYDAATGGKNNTSSVSAPMIAPIPAQALPVGARMPTNRFPTPAPAPTPVSAPSSVNASQLTVNAGSTTMTGEVKMPDVSSVFAKMFPQYSKSPFSDSKKQSMIENSIQIDDSITMQPQFSVSAPNVNVNVKVDKDERVIKQISILNPGQGTMLNNWYTRTSSQYGKTITVE